MNEQEFIEKYADRTASFRIETFRPLLENTFTYQGASGTSYELTLSKIEEGKQGGGPFESFTLLFTSPKNVSFEQGYYLLEHTEHGEFPLFLVPTMTLNPEHNCYCVYFSIRKNPVR